MSGWVQVMTSKVYLHDVTFVSPFSLMLFGSDGEDSQQPGHTEVSVMVRLSAWPVRVLCVQCDWTAST